MNKDIYTYTTQTGYQFDFEVVQKAQETVTILIQPEMMLHSISIKELNKCTKVTKNTKE